LAAGEHEGDRKSVVMAGAIIGEGAGVRMRSMKGAERGTSLDVSYHDILREGDRAARAPRTKMGGRASGSGKILRLQGPPLE